MRALLVLSLVLVASMAGCFGKKDGKDEAEDPDDPALVTVAPPTLLLNVTVGNTTFRFSSATTVPASQANTTPSMSSTVSPRPTGGNGTSAGNGTVTMDNATGNASTPEGPAPLNVTFELGATGLPNGTLTWTLDFGRSGNATGGSPGNATGSQGNATAGNATAGGNATVDGTTLPATLGHTYTEAGAYNVTFVVVTGTLVQDLQVTLHVEEGSGNVTVTPALPDQTHFEFGEALGCEGTAGADTCISFQGGPDASGIDGFWLDLGPAYWGLQLTSTAVQSPVGPDPVLGAGEDTDCVFTDDAQGILEAANNGAASCAGIVPQGAWFLFIYYYAAPGLEIVIDFAPPAAA